MSEIYSHEDRDGDGFYLSSRGDELKFRAYGTDHSFLTREDVTRLRNSLTEWLGENEAPRLTEADVRRIVQEEWVTRTPAPIVLGISADPEPQYIGHTEPDVWGAPCTGCRHSSALHLHDGCTHPECGCTRNERAALSTEASQIPAQRIRIIPKCGQCGAPWTDVHGQPGDLCTPSQRCGCPHPVQMHGPEAGCIECKCTWTGRTP